MPVFDQGYQHWNGPLAGHAWRWLAIARHGVRVQMQNRLLRLLVLFAWLPALGLVVFVALWGMVEQKNAGAMGVFRSFLPFLEGVLQDPKSYRSAVWTLAYLYFFQTEMFFIMLLAVVGGPGLISADLRFNALPLYLSRPLTRFDYFLGKLGVIGALVGYVAVGPAVFAYLVGVAFSLDLGVVRDTYRVLLAAVAYGLVITVSVGTLVLALSSLTRRSLYVSVTWAGLWIISGSVGAILTEIHRESLMRGAQQEEIDRWVRENPPPPGTVMAGPHPALRLRPGGGGQQLVGVQPGHEQEGERWLQAYTQRNQQSWQRAREGDAQAQVRAAREDWRPLVSYVRNLERIGHALLDTDAAWVTLGRTAERSRAALGARFGPPRPGGPVPAPADERAMADQYVPQYPWVWSAGVLAGLVGLSAWTLTRRVKSLDRLR